MGVGANLKAILKQKNITIKELSASTGISINTLYSITKRDSSNIRFDLITKIIEYLDISIMDLLGEPSGYNGSRILDDDDIIFLDSNKKEIEKYLRTKGKDAYINQLIDTIKNSITSLAIRLDEKELYNILFNDQLGNIFPEYIIDSFNISIERCNSIIDDIDLFRDNNGVIDGTKIMDYLYKGKKPENKQSKD